MSYSGFRPRCGVFTSRRAHTFMLFGELTQVVSGLEHCFQAMTGTNVLGRAIRTFLFCAGAAALVNGQSKEFATTAAQQAFVDKTCAGCHNDKLKSGGFTWSKIDLAHPEKNAGASETVIRMLRAGMM